MADRLERIAELLSLLVGDLTIASLNAGEHVVDAAEIDARLEKGLAVDDHIARRTSEGLASVALDEANQLVEYRPDGTSVVLIG